MEISSNSPLRIPPADYCHPGSERWFTLTEGVDEGKTLFYYDHLTHPDRTPVGTVLFVHGNPESSYTYRHIRDGLVTSGQPLRLIALDHIGFGLSDQADFEMVDMHHAVNLLQLVRFLDLRNLCLVIHDWGGPIGAGALIQEPERVSSLLLMNTTVFPMPTDGFTYRNFPFSWLPWYQTPNLIPDALWGGVAAAVVSHAQPQSGPRFVANAGKWLTRHALNKIADDRPEYVWSQMLRSRANARSSKRNVRQTPYWGHGYNYLDRRHGLQDNHAFYARMQADIPRLWGPSGQNIPVTGFFGQWDACGKDSVIAQWQEALPQIRPHTRVFPRIGHFIEEYKGSEMAQEILRMMQSA